MNEVRRLTIKYNELVAEYGKLFWATTEACRNLVSVNDDDKEAIIDPKKAYALARLLEDNEFMDPEFFRGKP